MIQPDHFVVDASTDSSSALTAETFGKIVFRNFRNLPEELLAVMRSGEPVIFISILEHTTVCVRYDGLSFQDDWCCVLQKGRSYLNLLWRTHPNLNNDNTFANYVYENLARLYPPNDFKHVMVLQTDRRFAFLVKALTGIYSYINYVVVE